MKSFAARLVAWHDRAGRKDLPWQNTRDPYRIWLSEIMLQQTQVATVIPYYQRFLKTFPDVQSLASAPIERVLEHWSGLGYYRRAHLLHSAARIVVSRHCGVFPRDAGLLAKLPGIGRSTAAAIAAFAYGTRGAILDGNVKRVLARHAGIGGYPGSAAVEAALWSEAEACLPQGGIESYTQAMMDLGATLCSRTKPLCALCPVADDCVARIADRVGDFPPPRPKKTLPHRAIAVLLIEHQREVFLERRPDTGIWGGLWSLPEIAVGEDARAVCRTRFDAELDSATTLPDIEHGFTHFTLTITPRLCVVKRWSVRAEEPGCLWLPLQDVTGAALPAPIKRLLRERAKLRGVPQRTHYGLNSRRSLGSNASARSL
jgi:A/G-specific adenine glycosylase